MSFTIWMESCFCFFIKVTFVYKEYTQYNVTSTVHTYLSCFDILDKEAWYHTLLVTLNVNTKNDKFSLYLTHLGSKRAFLHCQTCLYLTHLGCKSTFLLCQTCLYLTHVGSKSAFLHCQTCLYLTHLGSKSAFLHCQTCLYLTSFE